MGGLTCQNYGFLVYLLALGNHETANFRRLLSTEAFGHWTPRFRTKATTRIRSMRKASGKTLTFTVDTARTKASSVPHGANSHSDIGDNAIQKASRKRDLREHARCEASQGG